MPSRDPLPRPRAGLLDVEEQIVEVELADDPAPRPMSWRVFDKLAAALLSFSLLLAAAYVWPLPWAQPWRADEDYLPFWNLLGRGQGEGEAVAAEHEAIARVDELARQLEAAAIDEGPPVLERAVIDRAPGTTLRFPAYEPHPLDPRPEELAVALDDPEALASFYAALTLSDLGYRSAQTRVGHWGDSVIGNDGITSALRRRMQARFGDAGHGFHALSRYDASYRHRGVVFEERGKSRWQTCMVRNRCMADGHYGYGGATVWSSRRPASCFATVVEGPVGREVSLFELWYARQAGGGRLEVRIDGQPHTLETALAEGEGGEPGALVDAWARFELDDGPHAFEVRGAGGGPVRAYGVVLERTRPGVVWDGMALIGAFTKRLASQDPAHFAAQLEHRQLDLVVLSFGGNDMTRERSDLRSSLAPYEADYAAVLGPLRAAHPQLACLIMGPVDHGEYAGGRVVSRPIVARMSEAQRRVAKAHGCAFFDTLAAMGGPGSVARWRTRSLMSPDLAHPSPRGHQVLGAMVFAALMRGYVDYREARYDQPIPREPQRHGPRAQSTR